MNYPYCAVCRRHVAPDEAHVTLDAETKRPDDRNAVDNYVLHVDCWRSVSEGWMEP